MQLLAGFMLQIATMLAVAPSQAQTYDPRYPVCMEVYSIDGSSIDYDYSTMAQCAPSASGRSAQCFANACFAGTNRNVPVDGKRWHVSSLNRA
jgi:Protein of unknown function (DUF3551)